MGHIDDPWAILTVSLILCVSSLVSPFDLQLRTSQDSSLNRVSIKTFDQHQLLKNVSVSHRSKRIRRDDDDLGMFNSDAFDEMNKPRNPSDVADDTTCKLLYPCNTTTIKGIFNFVHVRDLERQEQQEKGLCYKHPADQTSDEEVQLKSHCYDPDPPAEDPDPGQFKPIVISHKIPEDINDGFEGAGFMMPFKPIYRFSRFFDIDNVSNSYGDIEGVIDFDIIDWPGKTYKDYTKQMMESQQVEGAHLGALKPCLQMLKFQGRSNKYLDYFCNEDEGLNIAAVGMLLETSVNSNLKPKKRKKSSRINHNGDEDSEMNEKSLNVEESKDDTDEEDKRSRRRKRSLQEPMCNKSLVATGQDDPPPYNVFINLRCNRAVNRDRGAQCAHWPLPDGRIYLVSGSKSMTRDFIQPMVMGEDVLTRLAQDPDSPDLPTFQGKPLECSDYQSKDIRTVLDFAFATNRLILGMKCGVILVKNVNSDRLEYDVAYLKSSDRVGNDPDSKAFHRFPFMINVVAATPCCQTNKLCRHLKPIVAIYSSYAAWIETPDSYDPDQPKALYVSWDNGDNFDRRIVASEDASINLIYWMYSKIPKWRIKDARPPHWVTEIWENTRSLEDNIDIDAIVVDPVTKLILQNKKDVAGHTHCDELISINSFSEENLLLLLCRDRRKRPSRLGKVLSQHSYQIFTVRLHEAIPMVSLTRRSKRKFSCTPTTDISHEGRTIEPSLIRVPNSYSIFILGCDKIVYSSGNGGKTLFASAFFLRDDEQANETHTDYVKNHENKFLTQFPLIAIDHQGQTAILTFGRYFAYGVIASSSEMSFVSGQILMNLPAAHKGHVISPLFIPYYNGAGVAGVGLPYIKLLDNSGESFFVENYKNRLALRLLDCSVSIHGHALPFYSDYADIDSSARSETLKPCKTYKFKTNVTMLSMDLGESQAVHVTVGNNLIDLPLNVLLTHDKAATLQVFLAAPPHIEEQSAILIHKWNIVLKAKPYLVDRETAQISAFFGSEYNNLEAVSAHLTAGVEPQLRCHVQPQQHVTVRFGCSKYMKAHEDERRLQCEGFREDFKYEIQMGHYDEEMAALWVRERPQFYKIEDGTLKITYDYEMFGCPVEPYRLDPYIPDLRLLSIDGSPNTTEGQQFMGNFVLIEIFGASGYSFTKKVKDAKCVRAPQTLEKMIREWKVRVEAARAAYIDYPNFDFEPIYQPLNIWNRVNYKDCRKDQFGIINNDDLGKADTEIDDMQDSPYEIMTHDVGPNEETNKLIWDQYLRQRVYIFLAVAVDPYDSFCNYHTFFGLSIAVPKEDPDIILICIFVGTILLLLFVIFIGYYARRWQVRTHFYKEAMYNRLLTAAWNLSFRYEKLLGRVKTSDPDVKQQVIATKKLKFRKHTGVAPKADEKPKTGLTGLRHRLRQ